MRKWLSINAPEDQKPKILNMPGDKIESVQHFDTLKVYNTLNFFPNLQCFSFYVILLIFWHRKKFYIKNIHYVAILSYPHSYLIFSHFSS